MGVTIGSLTFNDAWIRNKYGRISKEVKRAILSRLVLPSCLDVSQKDRPSVVAIDGTRYYTDCTTDISNQSIVATVDVRTPSLPLNSGDVIFIVVKAKNVFFRAVDIYGAYFTTTEDEIFQVRIKDEYDQYILKYKFCKPDGATHSEDTIEYNVATTSEQEKEIYINTCTSAQARTLGMLVGTRVSISDTEVSFPNSLITEVRLEYIASDMSDVAVKTAQGVDRYKGTVRFRV